MFHYPADHNKITLEYKSEIFEYMRELQDEMLPDPNYMTIKQRDTGLNWEMRSQLIRWIIKVHSRFNLRLEILFLTINYIDRFLSLKEVSSNRLQLAGAVALSIATKYENGSRVTMKSLQKLCGGRYKAEDFRKAEIYMLDKLQYKLGWPGPLIFLGRINEVDERESRRESRTRILAKYLLKAILPDERFVPEPPSITAAAGYCLARYMLGVSEWTPLHVRISGYYYSELYALMVAILEWLNQSHVFEKGQEIDIFVMQKLESGFAIKDQYPDSELETKNSLDEGANSDLDESSVTDPSSDEDSNSDLGESSDEDCSSEIYFST
ncbi:cyclin-like protein [Tricladium varicosporioides]|nr:cyclin-like protein [Hymenoscyphus varicosporioides]